MAGDTLVTGEYYYSVDRCQTYPQDEQVKP